MPALKVTVTVVFTVTGNVTCPVSTLKQAAEMLTKQSK